MLSNRYITALTTNHHRRAGLLLSDRIFARASLKELDSYTYGLATNTYATNLSKKHTDQHNLLDSLVSHGLDYRVDDEEK